jgi:hypothetical protein
MEIKNKMNKKFSADDLNFLVTDVVELIFQRTNISEDQELEIYKKIHNYLDEFFGFPEYNNYN